MSSRLDLMDGWMMGSDVRGESRSACLSEHGTFSICVQGLMMRPSRGFRVVRTKVTSLRAKMDAAMCSRAVRKMHTEMKAVLKYIRAFLLLVIS